MADIRAFIAVDIPGEIKKDIDRLIAGFRDDTSGIRWVKAANLHLTLRFLGDIPQESIANLAESTRDNLKGFGPFDTALSGMGGFPNLKKPRVIWIGTGEGTEKLEELADKVEKSCIESGFGKADKPFTSHLTVGRIKFTKGLESVINKIEKIDYHTSVFKVNEIAIIKSDLSPAGPKYSRLETVSL